MPELELPWLEVPETAEKALMNCSASCFSTISIWPSLTPSRKMTMSFGHLLFTWW